MTLAAITIVQPVQLFACCVLQFGLLEAGSLERFSSATLSNPQLQTFGHEGTIRRHIMQIRVHTTLDVTFLFW